MLKIRVLEGKGLRAYGVDSCYVSIETRRQLFKTKTSHSHTWDEIFAVSVSGSPPVVVTVNKTLHAVLQGEVCYTSLIPGQPRKEMLTLSPKGRWRHIFWPPNWCHRRSSSSKQKKQGEALLVLELVLQLPNRPPPAAPPAAPPASPPAPPPASPPPRPPAPTGVEALLNGLPPGVERLPWPVVEACLGTGTKIGQGGFGPVHRARLPDGREVAIKKRDPDSMQGMKEFAIEIRIVSGLRHPTIVKLLAVSLEGRNLALVYPFFKRGTLEDVLGDYSVGWKARLRIAADIAQGVGVLHALEPPILHRDISPDNVLLTDDLRAKLTDFGTARECPELLTAEVVHDEPRGKWHYMAPEVRKEGLWSTGADVYAVGVVLLQLLAGLRDPALQRPSGDTETPLTALPLKELPMMVPWPRLPCLMFFEDVRQCFAPRPERIGSWKLAQELQEMEEWGAGCPTPAEPEENP